MKESELQAPFGWFASLCSQDEPSIAKAPGVSYEVALKIQLLSSTSRKFLRKTTILPSLL